MYGQQITVQEQLKNNPSIFNNTGERFLLQNRIPLTLILEPFAHFNQTNSSNTGNNSYTEFKILLGRDIIAPSNISTLPTKNTFGQSITITSGDIHTPPDNGSYNSYIVDPSSPSTPRLVAFTIDATGNPLKVDRIYDVYIESITTFNILPNTGNKNRMAFVLEINDWNIDNNTNLTSVNRSIIIPNEATAANITQTHKSKKLNYLTHLTPDTINSISGRISFLNGENIFEVTPAVSSNDHRISIELILIPRNKN